MVDPDVLVVFGHVIDFDMFALAGDKEAGNTIAKEGSTKLQRHGHVSHAGEDDISIWIVFYALVPPFFLVRWDVPSCDYGDGGSIRDCGGEIV